jgi:acetylornithine deacetylase/succinyl-diaminopimelate desuccinylase-like protein
MAGDMDAIAAHPRVAHACSLIHASDADTLSDMRAIVRIAAPSLDERERASWVRERMSALRLADVALDEAGNVIAHLPGENEGLPPVVLAAHLDTVFPRATDLTLREANGRMSAPGIADNARGLAALLAIARALEVAEARPRHTVIFAATVGEEGIGDLRGVKHLFRAEGPLLPAVAFIALDGTGLRRIVHRAVGSRRLRLSVHGPGGHSWADRGVPNPIHAVGEAIAGLARAAPSRDAPAGLAIGRVGGGTSVNAIPETAWCELDLRAENPSDLASLETQARGVIRGAVDAANAARRPNAGELRLEVNVIGDRPSGETPANSPLVRAARAATRHLGERPDLVASSTDANVPIALGIPAIALGAGGESGRTHTTEEWFSNERGPLGIERALLTLIAVAGVR